VVDLEKQVLHHQHGVTAVPTQLSALCVGAASKKST